MVEKPVEGMRRLYAGDPHTLRSFHKWATILWFAAAPPICIFLASSIPFLVFISVYAVVTGHWSSWQAARVETRQEDDADVMDAVERLDAVIERLEDMR